MAKHTAERPAGKRGQLGGRRAVSATQAHRERAAEEAADTRKAAMDREKKLAAAMRIAFGAEDGPANLERAAKLLEKRGRQHDAAVADGLRRRAEAIVEARALIAARSWCPPQ